MDKIKSAFEYFKDNINLFILVPTVLGGLWQVFELASIDTSFVRFFSITQVVSDGLVLLVSILSFSIIYLFVFKFTSKSKDDEYEDSIYDNIFTKYIFLFLITAIFIYISYNLWSNKITTIGVIFAFLFINIILKLVSEIIKYHYQNDSNDIFWLVIFIIINVGVMFSGNLFNQIHNLYNIPNNIKNIEYLECFLGVKKKDFELIYLNDKYIFVEIKNTKQIEIVNFEEMLNKENCE